MGEGRGEKEKVERVRESAEHDLVCEVDGEDDSEAESDPGGAVWVRVVSVGVSLGVRERVRVSGGLGELVRVPRDKLTDGEGDREMDSVGLWLRGVAVREGVGDGVERVAVKREREPVRLCEELQVVDRVGDHENDGCGLGEGVGLRVRDRVPDALDERL